MYDICCVGHVTSDKVVNSQTVKYMPGGTAFYFSYALSSFNLNYLLVTALAETDLHYLTGLRDKGLQIEVLPSLHTVYFENIYGENQDERTQNVLQLANPFSAEQLAQIDARLFHLGPLISGDIPLEVIKSLSKRSRISVDVQGFLRRVEDGKVYPTEWVEKTEALHYIDILKADVAELRALTGHDNIRHGILEVAQSGVKEVIITNGSQGSLIYAYGEFYNIPAYQPLIIKDATGCGDTYMSGYLYRRSQGAGIQQAGEFAAAMAGLKTATAGPFAGTEDEVTAFLSGSLATSDTSSWAT